MGFFMLFKRFSNMWVNRSIAYGFMLALIAGCESLSSAVPTGFDLSGEWLLDVNASDSAPDTRAIRRAEDLDIARGKQKNVNASAAFVVQDFPVVAARQLVIEQNDDSLGIRYSNGTYRDVTWGRTERNFWQIEAGWSNGVLVIISRRDDIIGREEMKLEAGGSRLRVTVDVKTDGRDVKLDRVYVRGS